MVMVFYFPAKWGLQVGVLVWFERGRLDGNGNKKIFFLPFLQEEDKNSCSATTMNFTKYLSYTEI